MNFTVLGKLPTLNEMINAAKRDKYAYESIKKEAIDRVAWSAKNQKIKVDGQSDFIITWYCPNKQTDKDNIIAGQKYLFDGLQYAGVIKNDGWSEIGNISHRFLVDKKNPRVEIMIYRSVTS